MDSIIIIINDASFGADQPWNALRLVLTITFTAIKSKVNVFFLGDVVIIAKKGQRPPESYYNLEKMLTDLIREDGNVRACGTCLRTRRLNEDDLIKDVEIGTMMELAK